MTEQSAKLLCGGRVSRAWKTSSAIILRCIEEIREARMSEAERVKERLIGYRDRD